MFLVPNYDEGKDSFDSEGKLSYQNLGQRLNNSCDEITLYSKNDIYMASIGRGTRWAQYNFYVARINEILPIETLIHKELKIHISLEEELTRKIRTLGWNIVKYVLGKGRIGSFKVIRPKYNMSDDPKQCGKDITIYAGYDRHLDVVSWLHILQEITIAFVENNVKPGYSQQSTAEKPEKIVKGSKYFSYRYFDEVQQKSIPWPNPDPFENIDLSHIVQPFDSQGFSIAQGIDFGVK